MQSEADFFAHQAGLALLNLYPLDRFIYNVAAQLDIISIPDLPKYPGVRGCTNGASVFLTTSSDLADLPTQVTTLTHEVLHVILGHMVRLAGEKEYDPKLMNVAADLSLADIQIGLGQKPPITSIVGDWRNYLGLDMFEIYNLLAPDKAKLDPGHPKPSEIPSPEAGDSSGDEGEDGDGGEDGDVGDADVGNADEEGTGKSFVEDPSAEEAFKIESVIQAAAMQAETGGYSSKLSKSAARIIDKVRAKEIPWDEHLTQIASRLKAPTPTWVRPNRRMMSLLYLPSWGKKEQYECSLAMDVSGSVGEEPLNQMCAIAQDILTRCLDTLHLITFDDKVLDEWDLNKHSPVHELGLNGYGGTNVTKVYEHLKNTFRIPKTLVIGTDGFVPQGKCPGYPVIWLIVDNKAFKPEYGIAIHVNTSDLSENYYD